MLKNHLLALTLYKSNADELELDAERYADIRRRLDDEEDRDTPPEE